MKIIKQGKPELQIKPSKPNTISCLELSDIKYTYQKIPVLWGDLTYDKYQVKYEIVEECNDGNY